MFLLFPDRDKITVKTTATLHLAQIGYTHLNLKEFNILHFTNKHFIGTTMYMICYHLENLDLSLLFINLVFNQMYKTKKHHAATSLTDAFIA